MTTEKDVLEVARRVSTAHDKLLEWKGPPSPNIVMTLGRAHEDLAGILVEYDREREPNPPGFPIIIPEGVEKSKCPACPLDLPAEDLVAQVRHMTSRHPEIVAARRAESARWDGWEQD